MYTDVYVCVHRYIHTYSVCIYTHIYTHTARIHTHIRIYTHRHLDICTYVYIDICMRVCMPIHRGGKLPAQPRSGRRRDGAALAAAPPPPGEPRAPPGPVLRAPLGDARPLAGRGGGSWALLSSGVKGAFRNAAPANRFSDPDTLIEWQRLSAGEPGFAGGLRGWR